MTILSALVTLYDRMQAAGEAPRPGFSSERISFAIVLRPGKEPFLSDRRDTNGKKPVPAMMNVPEAVKRTAGIRPNMFWDKTSYVLGVIAVEEEGEIRPGEGKRTAEEHAAFVTAHQELLEGTEEPGLKALLEFLNDWNKDRFESLGWTTEALDQNIVFEFEDENGPRYVHDLPAVGALLARGNNQGTARCLVTGEIKPVARLHPSIKGVMGAQSTGASLVSFNNDAYESFGKSQGDNAPVSDYAAFAYGAALNALLARKASGQLERTRWPSATACARPCRMWQRGALPIRSSIRKPGSACWALRPTPHGCRCASGM